jgi:hypothetical protein
MLALAAVALTALAPLTASAALLWTLVVSPLTATAYQSTTFTFTASNLDVLGVLGCLEVDLPSSFLIQGAGTPTASNGGTWVTSLSGNAMLVHSVDNAGRLKLAQSVTFTLQARPTAAGAFALPNHSHVRFDCTSTDQPGVALPITVLPGATPIPVPTPTPKPTPSPTPRPSPRPTPSPAPTLPLPTLPLPTLPVPPILSTPPPLPQETATPLPADVPQTSPLGSASPALASGPPRRSSSSTASPFVAPSAANQGPPTTTPSAGRGGGVPAVRLKAEDLKLNTELGAALGASQLWFVPAAAIGAPGLLVLLWVGLQTAATLAWVPFVRRMRGQDDRTRGRSRRVSGP